MRRSIKRGQRFASYRTGIIAEVVGFVNKPTRRVKLRHSNNGRVTLTTPASVGKNYRRLSFA